MVPTNDFLPFCPNDTGTNLESQGTYAVDTSRTNGNQPGIASSKLNNKAIRQSTYVVSQFAQFLSNQLTEDVLDDATPAKLLAQFTALLKPYAMNYTKLLSGTGSFNLNYIFQIVSGNATVGATYTNNSVTFTVFATVSGATEVRMTGAGAPSLGTGTLTKATGTGDATLTFYAFRQPLYLVVRSAGGGGGGGGSGTSPGTGGTGGATTFGPGGLSAGGGAGGTGGSSAGVGGTGTLGTGVTGLALSGSDGDYAAFLATTGAAGRGGNTPHYSGGGSSVTGNSGSDPGKANTGGGGGGAGFNGTAATGAGGGSGSFVQAIFANPSGSFSWGVGAGGTAGSAGSGGGSGGGAGGSGIIEVEEHYQ